MRRCCPKTLEKKKPAVVVDPQHSQTTVGPHPRHLEREASSLDKSHILVETEEEREKKQQRESSTRVCLASKSCS